MEYPEEIRPYVYTTNMLERLIKEVKRRDKVIEVRWSPNFGPGIKFTITP